MIFKELVFMFFRHQLIDNEVFLFDLQVYAVNTVDIIALMIEVNRQNHGELLFFGWIDLVSSTVSEGRDTNLLYNNYAALRSRTSQNIYFDIDKADLLLYSCIKQKYCRCSMQTYLY